MVEQPAHTRYVPGSSPGTATIAPGTPLSEAERVAAVARVRRKVARALDGDRVLRPGEAVLIACSGGADSMTLLDVLLRLAPARDLSVAVAHVDHGLRADSSAEAGLPAQIAVGANVPFYSLRVDVSGGGSLQDRARRARHAALRTCARAAGAQIIALGHTADDQAETVLMRALSGASPRGLLAMDSRERRLARPLLRVWRSEVEAYCVALDLPFIDDPANRDRRFLRSRVRHDLLPSLEEVFPGARRRLVVLAERQRAALGQVPDGGAENRR